MFDSSLAQMLDVNVCLKSGADGGCEYSSTESSPNQAGCRTSPGGSANGSPASVLRVPS